MTTTIEAPSSRHLVAPEFLPGLELFPRVDFSQGPDAWRGDLLDAIMPPLPPELAAVNCNEQMIPGPPDRVPRDPGRLSRLRPDGRGAASCAEERS